MERRRGRQQATLTGDGLSVTVEIDGMLAPAAFAHLPDALATLWAALRMLPIGTLQHDAYRQFLTAPEAPDRVTEFLARDGRLELSFALGDQKHLVRVTRR